jgi:hypothetical protein
MRGVLRLGIQKTLGVVQSHNRVDLAALATGYIIVDDLDGDGVQAEVDRLNALATPATDILADDFEVVLFLNAPPLGPSSPKSSLALRPLGCSQKSSCAALCNLREFASSTCKLSVISLSFRCAISSLSCNLGEFQLELVVFTSSP